MLHEKKAGDFPKHSIFIEVIQSARHGNGHDIDTKKSRSKVFNVKQKYINDNIT